LREYSGVPNDLDQAIIAVQLDVKAVAQSSFNKKQHVSKLFDEIEKDLSLFHGKDADVFVSRAVESLVKSHLIPDLSLMNFPTKDAKISINDNQIEITNQGEKITVTSQDVSTKPNIMGMAIKDLKDHHLGRSPRSVFKKQSELQVESDKRAAVAKVNFVDVHVEANSSHWKAAVDQLQAKGVQNPSRQQTETEVAHMRAAEKNSPKK
jgi:hypothetical protein